MNTISENLLETPSTWPSVTSSPLLSHCPLSGPEIAERPSLIRRLVLWEAANRQLERWNAPGIDPFVPQPEHWPPLLSDSRFGLIAGGEGGGKSRVGAQDTFARTQPNRLYWLVAKQYDLTEREFEYLYHLYSAVGALKDARGPTKEGWTIELQGVFEGAQVRARTVDDARKIAGHSPSGIMACEAAQLTEEAALKLVSRVNRRVAGELGWLWFTGTFEGAYDWYHAWHEQWQADGALGESFSMPSWANRVMYPEGRHDPAIQELESAMPRNRFMERHAGVPVPPATLVHQEFHPKVHVGRVPFQPARSSGDTKVRWPVELWMDPGHQVYAVYAVQRDGDEVRVIDEIYATPPDSVAERVIGECRMRPWWKNVTGGVIDVAGTKRAGSESQTEIWHKKGQVALRASYWRIQDGIDRLSTFLEDPARRLAWEQEHPGQEPLWHDRQLWARLKIDKRCQQLVREFRMYRYPEAREGHKLRQVPVDADNHGIKALAYGLLMNFGPAGKPRRRARPIVFRGV